MPLQLSCQRGQPRIHARFKLLAEIRATATAAWRRRRHMHIGFQTPRGDSCHCNERSVRWPFSMAAVSNSSRRFVPLQLHHVRRTTSRNRFQTPRGDSCHCNNASRAAVYPGLSLFQTPRGDSCHCNFEIVDALVAQRISFKLLAEIRATATTTMARPACGSSTFQTPRGDSCHCN